MPIFDESWSDVSTRDFHVGIFTCGYERRSVFLANQKEAKCGYTIVLDYEAMGILNYDGNKKRYAEIADKFLPVDDQLGEQLRELLVTRESFLQEVDTLQIFFDVSSCSRRVMAIVLLGIASEFGENAVVTCGYALSAFSGAPQSELPSYISEPVVGTLSGWSEDLTRPPCAVIGMGFEPGRALGCMDYLEIPEARLLAPRGPDSRFLDAVMRANEVLIRETGQVPLFYDPLRPADTYEMIDSLLFGLFADFRPVIVPLGPKIFSAISIALAIQLSPRVCVWRTSAGPRDDTVDRGASGQVSVFSAKLPHPIQA